MAVEVAPGGVVREHLEQAAQRQRAAPVHKKAAAQRRTGKADGGVHAVDRAQAAPRDQEAADSFVVDRGPVKRWQRAHALAQVPDPPGYQCCWIARHTQTRGDDAGLVAAIQEGWEFCRRSDFPKHVLPSTYLADYGGKAIGNATAILMKLPVELVAQRDAYFNGRRDAATRAITKRKPGLPPEATHPKMPLVEDRNEHDMTLDPMRARRRREQAAAAADV